MQVNGVFFDKIRSFEQFKELIGNLNTQGGNFIIKLNWVESSKGQYT